MLPGTLSRLASPKRSPRNRQDSPRRAPPRQAEWVGELGTRNPRPGPRKTTRYVVLFRFNPPKWGRKTVFRFDPPKKKEEERFVCFVLALTAQNGGVPFGFSLKASINWYPRKGTRLGRCQRWVPCKSELFVRFPFKTAQHVPLDRTLNC